MPTWTPSWRRGLPVPQTEDPAAPGTGSPQPIGAILERMLSAPGPWQSGLAAGELVRSWADVVGDALAAETVPLGIDPAGVLTVAASSAGWATQVRFLSQTVVRRANEALERPVVVDVRVVIGRPQAGREPPQEG